MQLSQRILFLEKKTTNINDVFQNTFTQLDPSLTTVSAELASTMAIVVHLRDTYHGLLQSRRAILHDIVLYLSDKAKLQV